MSEPELVWNVEAELGEGPVWDAPHRAVWFVDVKGRRLHRYGVDDGAKASWDTPEQTGFALPAEDGSLVCGVRGGPHRFDQESGQFDLIVRVEEDRPRNRLNDGFVAPDGSLWFGSMDDTEATVSGALYRFHDGKVARHDDGYRITNGPAMSPDGPGVDAEGMLHVGLSNGRGVARFSPNGERIGTIRFPVQTVTKAAFGGDDLRDLYCTTAWLNNADRRTGQPTPGGLPQQRVRL